MPRPPIELSELTCTPEMAARRIAENWQAVRKHVDSLATQRPVRIVGVSKYVCAEITCMLVQAGCHDLGENRPQALWDKAQWMNQHRDQLDETFTMPRWHQIGHLQRNKVRRLLKCQPFIHAIDSDRLLDEVHSEAISQNVQIPVLIEINVSGESAKTGLAPDTFVPLLERWRSQCGDAPSATQDPAQPGANPVGLMAMAGWGTSAAKAQSQFATLRELRDLAESTTGESLPELSMGMSGDYEAAIAEGSTMVRIGSKLFDGILPD